MSFLVTDIVGNQSEDWSPETRIIVTIGTDLLPAPIAKDAHNNKIDLDQLGNKDLIIQVWTSAPSFKLDDIIALKMRGTSVDGDAIEVEAPAKTIDNLPHIYEVQIENADALTLANTQVVFSYTLKRNGSTEPLRSKNQFVKIVGDIVRLAAPIAEDAHQGAIDPDLPDAYIRIPFDPRIQVGMAIELSWIGRRHDGTTYDPALEWHSPSNSEVDNPQGFLIPVKGIHLKTLEGGKLDLSYTLLSEKENGEILRRKSHKAAQLNVGEPSLELVAPEVLGERDGTLEPNDLPQGTSQLIAPKSAVNPTKPNDVVTYTWVGNVSGKTEDSITLNSLSAGKNVLFHLSTEFVARHIEPNRGKKIKTWYRILRAETGKESYSNELEFSVGNALQNPLPVVRVPQASGSGSSVTLAPLDAKDGAIVIVAYEGMNTAQNIKLNVEGKPGAGSPDIPAKPGSTSGSVEFLIESQAIAANIGNGSTTLNITYVVTEGSINITSLPLSVTITPLPMAELDKLSILQANGDELDISKLTAGATISAGVWAFIQVGQPVWLVLIGTNTQGAEHILVVWKVPGAAVNAGWITAGKYNQGVYYDFFKDLADGSNLELHFKAALTFSQVEADAIVAPVKRYRVKAVEDVKPTISSVKGSPSGIEIPEGATTYETSVILSGTASKGQKVQILDGTDVKDEALVDPTTGIWTSRVSGLSAVAHSFTAKGLYGAGQASAARGFTVIKTVSGSENWDLAPRGIVAFDAPMKLPSGLTLTVSKMTSAATNADIYVIEDMPELGQLLATNTTTKSRYAFGVTAKKVTITYRASAHSENGVSFYNLAGDFLHDEKLVVDAFEVPHTVTFEHGSGCDYFFLFIGDAGPFNGIAVTDITWN